MSVKRVWLVVGVLLLVVGGVVAWVLVPGDESGAPDHTVAEDRTVATNDRAPDELRPRWRAAGVGEQEVTNGTVVVYQDRRSYNRPALIALDADTGKEVWHYRVTTADAVGGAVVVDGASGVVVLTVGHDAVLLDIVTGELVDVLPFPDVAVDREYGWRPVTGPYQGLLGRFDHLMVFGAADPYDGSFIDFGLLVRLDVPNRAFTTVERPDSGCGYELVSGDRSDYLIRSNCDLRAEPVVTEFRDGRRLAPVSVPTLLGVTCDRSCEVVDTAATGGALVLGLRMDDYEQYVSLTAGRLNWQAQPTDSLAGAAGVGGGRVMVDVGGRREIRDGVTGSVAGTTTNAPIDWTGDALAAGRWYQSGPHSVDVYNLATFTRTQTVDIGCEVTDVNVDGAHVVAACDTGDVVGLA